MPDVWIAIISAFTGAILGGFISWISAKNIINTQETIRAEREFREFLINLITKINHADFCNQKKLWFNLREYLLFSDEAVYNASFCFGEGKFIQIEETYNHYKDYCNLPDSELDKKKHEEIRDTSVANLKEILDIIK